MVGHAESSKRRWISDHYVDLMVHQRIFFSKYGTESVQNPPRRVRGASDISSRSDEISHLDTLPTKTQWSRWSIRLRLRGTNTFEQVARIEFWEAMVGLDWLQCPWHSTSCDLFKNGKGENLTMPRAALVFVL